MSAFARTAWAWLADYPSTNGRIFASTIIASIYALVVVVCLVIGRKIDGEMSERLQWFLFGMMVADVASLREKRKSWQQQSEPTAPLQRPQWPDA